MSLLIFLQNIFIALAVESIKNITRSQFGAVTLKLQNW